MQNGGYTLKSNMAYKLLSRRELEIINRKNLRYPLAIAEKDYMLLIILCIISKSSLKDKLIFKGGTAIHHCYLQQLRFSEDLDFTSLDKSITLEAVKRVFEKEDFLEIKKEFTSQATIKIERLKYTGPLELPNSLKIEIDKHQNVALPSSLKEYKNIWGVRCKVRVMNYKEICAEKLRATNERARYRDFYDLYLMLEKYNLNLKEILQILKQKEMRKPIKKSSILANWKIAQEESKSSTVLYTKKVADTGIFNLVNSFKL